MYFNFWTHLYWFIFWMATPFLSGFISGIITKHKAPSSASVYVGLLTSLIVMILNYVFKGEHWLVWTVLANAACFGLFSFWWKTDESKKWLVWGAYAGLNTIFNIVTFYTVWSLQ